MQGEELSVDSNEIYEVLIRGHGARLTICLQTNRDLNNMRPE